MGPNSCSNSLVSHPPWWSFGCTVNPDVLKEVRVVLQGIQCRGIEGMWKYKRSDKYDEFQDEVEKLFIK